MGVWILDFVLVAIAVLLMGIAVYKVMFSATEETRRDVTTRPRPRFERRETERADRRQRKGPAPNGVERRVGPRR